LSSLDRPVVSNPTALVLRQSTNVRSHSVRTLLDVARNSQIPAVLIHVKPKAAF
jgi:hypothetical protein